MSGRFSYHVEFSPHFMGVNTSPVFASRRRAHRYACSLPSGSKYEIIRTVSVAATIERGHVKAKP